VSLHNWHQYFEHKKTTDDDGSESDGSRDGTDPPSDEGDPKADGGVHKSGMSPETAARSGDGVAKANSENSFLGMTVGTT
jgi:hypothetical protein